MFSSGKKKEDSKVEPVTPAPEEHDDSKWEPDGKLE